MLKLITKKEMNMCDIVKYLATRRVNSTVSKTMLTIDKEEISGELIESILHNCSISEIRNYEDAILANTFKLRVKFQEVEGNFQKFLEFVSSSKCKMDVSENFSNIYLEKLKETDIEQVIDLLYDKFEIEEAYIIATSSNSVFEVSNEKEVEAETKPKVEAEAKPKVEVETEPKVETDVKAEAEIEVKPKKPQFQNFEMYLEDALKESLDKVKTSEKSYQETLSDFLTEIGMDKKDKIIFKAFEVSRNLEKMTVTALVEQLLKESEVHMEADFQIQKHIVQVFNSWAVRKFPKIRTKYCKFSIISLIKLFVKYAPNSVETSNDAKVIENETPVESDSTLEHENVHEDTMVVQMEENVQEEKETSNREALREFLQNKFGEALSTPNRAEGIRTCDVNIVLKKMGFLSKNTIIQSAFLVSAIYGPETFDGLIKDIKQRLELYKKETDIKAELIIGFGKYNLAEGFTGKDVSTEEVIMTILNLFSKRPNKNYFTNKK